jgi:hypothetical protein
MWRPAQSAAITILLTTRAKTGIAPNAKGQQRAIGWLQGRMICCQSSISMCFLLCLRQIARIAYWNKKAVYGLLLKASAQTVSTIAADPKRLGARVGMTSVLHTSRQRRVFDTTGSALTHHPHIHMIVPGGGLSPNGNRWVACKPGFFLHVWVLSRLFRRLFIEGLLALHRAGELSFFGDLNGLSDPQAFAAYLAPLRKIEWVVIVPEARLRHDAKPPFGGPEHVLAYLSRYTHPIARQGIA